MTLSGLAEACRRALNGLTAVCRRALNILAAACRKAIGAMGRNPVARAIADRGKGVRDVGSDALDAPQAFVIRMRTADIVPIERGALSIGRDPALVDYAVEDNDTLSRRHATIFCRDDRFYIVDNGATNKTFVRGAEAPAGEEIEITSGTRVKLSDEAFIFYDSLS